MVLLDMVGRAYLGTCDTELEEVWVIPRDLGVDLFGIVPEDERHVSWVDRLVDELEVSAPYHGEWQRMDLLGLPLLA